MPIFVLDDITEGSVKRDKTGIISTTRAFKVSGFEGEPGHAKGQLAIMAAGIPRPGFDLHPSIGHLVCTDTSANLVHDQDVTVVANYLARDLLPPDPPPDPDPVEPPKVSIGASIQAVDTTLDVDGNLIFIHATPPTGSEPEDPAACNDDGLCTYGPITVQTQLAQSVRGLTRFEEWATALDLGAMADFYVGTMNIADWAGWAARAGLCTSIQAELVELVGGGGLSGTSQIYSVAYQFQRNDRPGGWDATVVAEENGKPVVWADSAAGYGFRTVQIYRETNFNELQL